MNKAMTDFMNGVLPPKRSLVSRLVLWFNIKLFLAGEKASSRISDPANYTALEQMYIACRVAGCTPELLRNRLKQTTDQLYTAAAAAASKRAAMDGVVQ